LLVKPTSYQTGITISSGHYGTIIVVQTLGEFLKDDSRIKNNTIFDLVSSNIFFLSGCQGLYFSIDKRFYRHALNRKSLSRAGLYIDRD
jgi:hypothetical protein